MNTVTFLDYENDKCKFVKAHGFDYTVHTSPLENDTYHKEWVFADDAVFYERISLVSEWVDVEAHGMTFKAKIQFWKTEYWSTEDTSKFFYEKY